MNKKCIHKYTIINIFFKSLCTVIDDHDDNSSERITPEQAPLTKFSLSPIKLLDKLIKINVYKSRRPGMLHPRILKKHTLGDIGGFLTLIYNSLEAEKYFRELNVGNITPLLKSEI